MDRHELCELDILQAMELIKQHQVSPVELTQACLDRIGQLDGKIQAWITVLPEQALAAAREMETMLMRGEPIGPLLGIPFAAKDLFYTAGIRTTGGSQADADFVPDFDASVLIQLKKAGAILLGKTTTTEYAFLGGPPKTRNPWNLNHTPGGSSAGSAAALAASMALFSLGTQTAGSVLRPAAYNGLTGLKATYGRISRHGVIALSWSLDHTGLFAKSVADAALLLSVMAGYDSADPGSADIPVPDFQRALERDVRGMTVGVPSSYFTDGLEDDLRQHFETSLHVFRELGVNVREVELPASFHDANAAHWLIMRAEAAAYHQDAYEKNPHLFGESISEAIEIGMRLSSVDYLRAQRIRSIFQKEMNEQLQQVDAWITPSTPTSAPFGISTTGLPTFNTPFTNAGVPAISIPMGLDRLGLPTGLQIVAKSFQEETLFALGHAFQTSTDWHQRRPANLLSQ